MDKNFIAEMNLAGLKEYRKPFIITFVALPGSEKTNIARELSKSLKIYLLSNDYIRNYYYQFTNNYSEETRLEIEDKVKEIQEQRIQLLIDHNLSFILDKCLNNVESYEELKKRVGENYHIIRVKVNSTDSINIKNISNIKMDYNFNYEGVIGDNVEYRSSFPKDVYYQIKERIPILVSDDEVDFVINDMSQIEDIKNYILRK